AALRQRPDHDPHRGRAPRADGRRRRQVPAGEERGRRRAHPPLPPRLGHDHLRLRRAPEPLREVLLRRPGAHPGGPLPELRQGAVRAARRRVPGGVAHAARGGGGGRGRRGARGRRMSPVTPANPAPPFAVVRVAHVELGVADLERSRAFYEEALGLVVTEQADGALYLRGLEERSHHSLVLRQEAAGRCLRLGFRVAAEADLERAFAFFAERELAPAWAEAPGQGRTLHVSDPFGQPLALYASQARVERRLQRYGEYRGAAIQRLDHVNLFAAELQATHDFYAGQLGFRTSEYTDTDEAEPRLWAVWMHRKGNVHDVALTNGVGP